MYRLHVLVALHDAVHAIYVFQMAASVEVLDHLGREIVSGSRHYHLALSAILLRKLHEIARPVACLQIFYRDFS